MTWQNLPAKTFFTGHETLCKNRQLLLLQWLNVVAMFLFFFPLATLLSRRKNDNKQIYWFINQCALTFSSFCMFSTNGEGCSLKAIVLRVFQTYSVCSAYAVRIFSTPMLPNLSIHTACGCCPAVHSRSCASAAVQRSFSHRVYFCCAAGNELKWQRIFRGKN